MAENKKKYSIEINGVKQSIDAIDALLAKVNELDSRLQTLQKKTITINVKDNISSTNTSAKTKNNTGTAVDKAIEQQVNLENEAYLEQLRILTQIQDSNKSIVKENQQIARGVKDISGEYANTLAGQRAYLSELKQQLANTELGTDQWEELGQEVLKVNENVKVLEESYGVFTRSVGNYEKAAGGFRSIAIVISDLKKNIDDTTKSIAAMKTKMSTMDTSSNEYAEASRELDNLNSKLAEYTKQLADAGKQSVNFGNSVRISLDGVDVEYDSLNAAIGKLNERLQALTVAGKTNTTEFKNVSSQLKQLNKDALQANNTINELNTGSSGLNNTLSMFQGFAGIASIGQGLSQLFGAQSEELDKTLKTFTALMLVLQGIQAIQNSMEKQDAFGKFALSTVSGISTVINWLTKYKDTVDKKIVKIDGLKDLQKQLTDVSKTYEEFYKAFDKLLSNSSSVKNIKEYEKVFNELSNKLNDLKSNLISAKREGIITEKEFDNLTQTFDNLLSTNTGDFTDVTNGIEDINKNINKLEKNTKRSITTINLFKNAFTAMITGGIFLLISKAIGWVIDGMNYLFVANTKLIDSNKTLTSSTNAVNKVLEEQNKLLEKQLLLKEIDTYAKLGKEAENTAEALAKIVQQMNNITSTARGAKPLDEFLGSSYSTSKGGLTFGFTNELADMEEFIKRYQQLTNAVVKGEGLSEASGETGFSGWWKRTFTQTFKDSRSELSQLQKALLNDVQDFANRLDWSDAEASMKAFVEYIEKSDDGIRISAMENAEAILKDRGKNLNQLYNEAKKYYDNLDNLQTQQLVKEKENNRTTLNNNTQAIQERFKRERELLNNQHNQEVEDAANNQELIASINKKYSLQYINLLKSQSSEVRAIRDSITGNEIATMNDGFEKQLAQLKLQQQQELQAARDSAILVGEQEIAINNKYDKLILDLKKDFLIERENLYKQYLSNIIDLSNEIANIEFETAQTSIDFNVELRMGDPTEMSKSFEEILALQNEQSDRLAAVRAEKLEWDYENQKRIQNENNDELLKELKKSYDEKQLTEEQYSELVRKNSENNTQYLLAIEKQYQQDSLQKQKDNENEKYQNNAAFINKYIAQYRDIYSELNNLQSRAVKANSTTGIIDYNSTKKNLKNVKTEYQNLMTDIMSAHNTLQQQLDNKEITFNDFQQAKKELNSLQQSTEDAQQSADKSLDTLVTDTAQSIAQYVGQYMNVIGGLWNTFNEMAMDNIEQEQARLDEELEMIEKAYEKQEAITQKHTDKLKSIDEQLRESRGSNRQHLIDQLNAERKAQEASLVEEQKIQKEKEENEKKQDALEKKRREQEKKNSIVQATINTFTAMTNALAVQPWFVGAALSAVALAMGMAQVANIKKQKYAKGGLLEGNSHNRGGIAVGNTGIEVEGKEYIVRKSSTQKNLPLLEYINNSERKLDEDDMYRFFKSNKKQTINSNLLKKFADGGQLPTMDNINVRELINEASTQDDRPIYVSVTEIENVMEDVRQVRALSGIN